MTKSVLNRIPVTIIIKKHEKTNEKVINLNDSIPIPVPVSPRMIVVAVAVAVAVIVFDVHVT